MILRLFLLGFPALFAQLSMNNGDCGRGKFCMMKPTGCHPDRDCTQGYMLSVVGANKLKVEMFAQALIPAVSLQYLAVGFSKDKIMGDDMVSECIMSEVPDEPAEVFFSFNRGKSNDRLFFEGSETKIVYADIRSSNVNGRLACSFVQSILPELSSSHDGRIIDLDEAFYIFGATGSSQPDEVNAHELSRESFYFPLISDRLVNPSKIGNNTFAHPNSRLDRLPESTTTTTTTPRPQSPIAVVSSASFLHTTAILLLPFTFFLF